MAGIGRLAGKSFLLRIGAAGMTYLFVVALARMMNVADFGTVGTIMSASLLFSVIGSLGQRMALLRFVPPLIEAPDAPPPVTTIARAFRLALSGNFVVFLLLAAAALVAGAFGWVQNVPLILFGLIIVPLTGMIDMQAHLARAYRSIVLAILPKDVFWRLISMLLLGAVYFGTGRDVPLWLAFAVLAGVLVLLILGQGAVMRRRLGVPGILRGALQERIPGRDLAWERARLPLWAASITAIAFTNLDVVAAGVLIGPKAAALYFAANRVALVPGLFLISYNIVVGPLFSGHHAAGRQAELRQVAQSASLQVFFPTLAAVIALGALAPLVLQLFGPEFVAATPVLRLLLLAALVTGAFGPSDLMLTMCGHERVAMQIGIWGTSIGAALIVLGALAGSAESLACGTLAAVIFARGLSLLATRRNLGFSVDAISALRTRIRERQV